MRILYLTTSLRNGDYAALLKEGTPMPNPSNQNFHCRMIEALQAFDEVTVLSAIPANLKKGATALGAAPYHYVWLEADPFSRVLGRKKQILAAAEGIDGNFDLIVYDPLNRGLALAAPVIAKRRKMPSVAILTDNPANLTYPDPFLSHAAFASVRRASACLALSEGLLAAYEAKEKPHFVTEGLVREGRSQSDLPLRAPYFYYAGTLLPRYGIEDLIKAYELSRADYDLLIAGHGAVPSQALRGNGRIFFLGQLSENDNLAYEEGASLLINPRPFEERLDREAVPSKVLEYLASGAPVLSTWHSKLQELFPHDVNWLADSGTEAIRRFFEEHLNAQGKLTDIAQNKAAEKVRSMYGLKAQGERIHRFLAEISSFSKASMTLEKEK